MKKIFSALILLIVLFSAQMANAAGMEYMDMNNWMNTGPGLARWEVANGGRTVTQSENGDPVFFVSDSVYQNIVFKSTVEVGSNWDDDIIGVVAAFQSPLDTVSYDFKTILFDWKMKQQDTGGYTSYEGMALSDVDGTFFIDYDVNNETDPAFVLMAKYFWAKTDTGPNANPQWDVLATNYGTGKGFIQGKKYQFEMLATSTRIIIKIDGIVVFNQEGTFAPGRVGFYNYSQHLVEYGNVQIAPGSTVPTAPVTGEDRYGTTPGTTLTVDRFEGVLKNDYDPNLDNVHIELVSTVSNGTLNLDTNTGAFTYIPDPGYQGKDSFSYRVVDDGFYASEVNTVTLGVISNNQTPTDIALSKSSVLAGAAVNTVIGSITTSDFNNPVDQHDYTLTNNGGGRFKVVGNELRVADSQSLTGGTYTVTVRSTDLMGLFIEKSFNISVNTAPTGANDTISVAEDATYSFTAADFTYADADADSFAGIQIETTETVGDLEYNGVDASSGVVIPDAIGLTFTPDPNANGNGYSAFNFRVIDSRGALSASTYTMTIDVTAVDDAPVLANPISDVTVDEDAFNTTIDLTNVFDDIDDDNATIIKSVLSNSKQSLMAANITGNVLTLDYQPDQNGTATIVVRGTSNGKTVDDSFVVTVNAVNDAPMIANQTLNVPENSAVAASVGMVLADDVDSGQVLTYIITAGNTNNAFAINSTTGELTLSAAILDYEGTNTYALTVSVADNGEPTLTSSGTVTVNVTDVNDPPTGADTTVSTNEDTPYTFSVADFGYADQDGDALSMVKIPSVAGAGSLQVNGGEVTPATSISKADLDAGGLTFTPAADATGSSYASFQFTVNDGMADSIATYTMSIDVTGEDDIPVAANPISDVTVDEDAPNTTVDLANVFDDVDNDNASIIKSVLSNSDPSLVAANITGNVLTLDYQPDQNGTATIVVQGTSNGKTVDDSFVVTVNAVNDAPILGTIGNKSVLEGETLTFPIVISDLETVPEQLQLTITGLPVKASVSNNQFTWTPAYGEGGNYPLTFTVSDGELTASESITIMVGAVDRPEMAFTMQDSYDYSPLNPGDIITYQMRLTNTGQAALADAIIRASIPSNTSYVPGSTALNGQAVSDSKGESSLITGLMIASPGEAQGVVAVGTDKTVLVQYSVQVLQDVAPGALITNQARLFGSGYGSGAILPVVSDDPETAVNDDATVSSVGNRPIIQARMTVTDDDGDSVEPGDRLTYSVKVTNQGALAATAVKLNNDVPAGTAFVSDSLTVSRNGLSEQANYTISEQGEILVDLGEVRVSDLLEVNYQVQVNTNLSAEISVISSQGLISATELPDEMTDQDADDSNGDQPTDIAVGQNSVLLTGLAARDLNGGGVSPGDELEFSITVENIGRAPATDLIIGTNLPAGLNYLNTTTTVNGEQTANITDQPIDYGVIAPGEKVLVNYRVQVPADTQVGTVFASRAMISGSPEAECTIQIGGSPGSAKITGTVSDQLGVANSPEGWIVELYQNDIFIGNRVLDETGDYSFTGLQPGTNYQVSLRHPETGIVYSNQDIGQLQSGMVGDALLPMDPSGVVYDSVARTPVEGAIAKIYGPDGNLVPEEGLLPGQQNQRTGADGRYRFDLRIGSGAPEGVYKIVILPPAEYSQFFPSAVIKPAIDPAQGAFDPPAGEVYPVSQSEDAPQLGEETVYYLSFNLALNDPDIINNHIPVDPDLGTALKVTKSADKQSAGIGDFVTYSIKVENPLPVTMDTFALKDIIPAGFKYVAGSATVNGVKFDAQGERPIIWNGLTLSAEQSLEIKYTLLVGTGVANGLTYTNRAVAIQEASGQAVSNIAEAGVKIIRDPIFAQPTVIGKVFVDRDGDGLQQDGEEGLANIGLYTLSGEYITTDSQGRFHLNTGSVRSLRGENFLLKLDTSTLPEGVSLRSENPQVVRLTPGIIQKINFAVVRE